MIRRLWRSEQRYELVNPSRVRELADEVMGADLSGFTRLKDGRYAKKIDADITHLAELLPWKGAQYSLAWGVSLSYVPNKVSLPLRFHRTLNSARLDLWQDSHSRAEPRTSPSDLATGSRGEHVARSGLAAMWRWAFPLARTWWGSASTLDGILEIAVKQAVTEQPGEVRHYPSPLLIHVLTLARLGRSTEIDDPIAALTERVEPHELQAILIAADRVAPSP